MELTKTPHIEGFCDRFCGVEETAIGNSEIKIEVQGEHCPPHMTVYRISVLLIKALSTLLLDLGTNLVKRTAIFKYLLSFFPATIVVDLAKLFDWRELSRNLFLFTQIA